MIEIIKRHEGRKSKKIAIESGRIQVSYNSDGRLVVRVIHDDEQDTLIVLNPNTTRTIKRFVNEVFPPNHPDLPF